MTTTIPNESASHSDAALGPLMAYVISATGLVYYCERQREFAKHVASRTEALGLNDYQSYLQRLRDGDDGDAELDRLIALLTIGETHFFRHRELFRALETTVFPELIERNKRRRQLRIWSAGCSIGAEPYSLSMLLRHRFREELPHWDVQIIGTDINREFLDRAAAGQFQDWALRNVSGEERRTFFSHDGMSWTVKPEFQQGVSFRHHNLAAPQFSSPLKHGGGFDLILCRNVMIYFSLDVVRRSIQNLHTCLADDGWLAVGHAEHNVNWFHSFRTLVSDGAVLYQKSDAKSCDGSATHERDAGAGDTAPGGSPPASERFRLTMEAPAVSLADPLQVPKPAPASCDPDEAPGNDAALQNIRSLADRGNLVEALERCRTLQRSDRQDPSPHFYQAMILQQNDDDSGAEQALKRAIYLDRTYPLAHYYLGLLMQKQRHVASAARAFHNVIRLLADRSPEEPVRDADELTVADLNQLSVAHLNVLEST